MQKIIISLLFTSLFFFTANFVFAEYWNSDCPQCGTVEKTKELEKKCDETANSSDPKTVGVHVRCLRGLIKDQSDRSKCISECIKNKNKDWENPNKDWENPNKDWENPNKDWENPNKDWENPNKDWVNPYSFWENPFKYLLDWFSHWWNSLFGNWGYSNEIQNSSVQDIENSNNNINKPIQSRKLINTDEEKNNCNGKIEAINGKEYCVVYNTNYSPKINENQNETSNSNTDPIENYNENMSGEEQNSNNQETTNTNIVNDSTNKDAVVGSPVIVNTNPCIGTAPENSEPCPGDEEEIYYYSERKLADVCSIPEGSEPKCEYVCKNEYDFVNDECASVGFFARIINWFGGLF